MRKEGREPLFQTPHNMGGGTTQQTNKETSKQIKQQEFF